MCAFETTQMRCLFSLAVWARRGSHRERPGVLKETLSILPLCRAVMSGGEGRVERRLFFSPGKSSKKPDTCHDAVHSSLAGQQIAVQQNTSRRSCSSSQMIKALGNLFLLNCQRMWAGGREREQTSK